jgi:hypothetical protein
VLFEVLFIGREVLTLYKKWVYFCDPAGQNLMKAYYDKHPHPQHEPNTYGALVLNYDYGCLYADHLHLRKLMAGIHVTP